MSEERKISEELKISEVGQTILVDGREATVLGWQRYNPPGIEYLILLNGANLWLELYEGEWRTWTEKKILNNPVVELIKNHQPFELGTMIDDHFIVTATMKWKVVEVAGDIGDEGEEPGSTTEWWEGKDLSGKAPPNFAIERYEDGEITYWVGKPVQVATI